MRYLTALILGLTWAQTVLKVDPPEQSFGRVAQGTLVKAQFRLINAGSTSIQLQEVKPSCSCSVVSLERRTLAPNETTAVEVSFNTAGKVGRQRKSFTVLSSATNSPTTFYLVGEVEAPSPYEHD